MGGDELPRSRRALTAFALGAALLTPGAARSATSFIPIPEIITDPNEGNTVGLLGVVLFLDEKDEIRYMLAPDLQYNRTKGVFPTFRLFGYPTPLRRYSILVGKSTTRDEDYELELTDRGYWEERAFILASFVHERDSTDRFFGFGNESAGSRTTRAGTRWSRRRLASGCCRTSIFRIGCAFAASTWSAAR